MQRISYHAVPSPSGYISNTTPKTQGPSQKRGGEDWEPQGQGIRCKLVSSTGLTKSQQHLHLNKTNNSGHPAQF